ncbi:MAG TPA: PQQ-binding-like beta-propeller repeat protein [Gemmataceae bacterium]|nr:PQQ-binding-like beta-propeller repeat protein [Gemmataceae bacterium]
MTRFILASALTLTLALALSAGDWAQFKGPNAAGVSDEKNLPVEWGKDKGIKWKAELPARGVSSPVVASGKVYVTCSSGVRDDRLHVLCFDAATGKPLWHRQLQATGGTACHPKTCMAAPTPVADETGVYALFATGDLAAFDADGTLRWYRSLTGDYPTITNQVGMASSPLLVGDKLIVPMDNVGESFLAAVDVKYGKNVWKTPRVKDINWVTPVVRTVGGKPEVLFAGPDGLTAYDADTGTARWNYKEGVGSIPTGVLAGDTLYLPIGGMTAVKLGEKGVEGKPLWQSKEVQPGMPSPLVYLGKVYATNGNGFISCGDAKTGTLHYKERVKGAFSASPVAGDGKVYCLNETGVTTVIDAKAETFEVLASNDLGEETLGTPAIAGGCIFIRTSKTLYCVGK